LKCDQEDNKWFVNTGYEVIRFTLSLNKNNNKYEPEIKEPSSWSLGETRGSQIQDFDNGFCIVKEKKSEVHQ